MYIPILVGLNKKTEHETYRLLLKTLPANISMYHAMECRDEDKAYEVLDILSRLNMDSENIATSHIRLDSILTPTF